MKHSHIVASRRFLSRQVGTPRNDHGTSLRAKRSNLALLGALICVVLLCPPGGLQSKDAVVHSRTMASDDAPSSAGVAAITKPSKDVALSFIQPGRIAEVLVKEGDLVKAGQPLIQQDDAIERAQLAQLEAQSQDTTQVEAARATLDQKRVDLKRLVWAAERGSATELEVEHAKLDVTIAELSLKLAQFQHEQDKRKYDEMKIRVDKMRMLSPIDGRVEKINYEPGESVDIRAEVLRVVQINPLWIEAPVPLAEARTLKNGRVATVRFPGSDGHNAEGKVVHVATVADAASETLTIRIEVPNDSGRPAGEHVRVFFLGSG